MVQPFPSATQAKSQTEVIATNAKIPFQMRKYFIAGFAQEQTRGNGCITRNEFSH